jgi:hypothetical protein
MMNKDRIIAIAARGEEIKRNSAEFLWLCCGIKPPLLPDPPKPIAKPGVDPAHPQLQLRPRPLNNGGAAISERKSPAK